jgi:transcriptional regulator with XRE-family HTH domain
MSTTPPVRRRLAGTALCRCREGLGWTLDDAASVLGCDRSQISRIETGHRGIGTSELCALLTEYGASQQAAALAAIAGTAATCGWWSKFASAIPPVRQDYYALETAASQILIYEAQRIPGLLQTPSYAWSIASS